MGYNMSFLVRACRIQKFTSIKQIRIAETGIKGPIDCADQIAGRILLAAFERRATSADGRPQLERTGMLATGQSQGALEIYTPVSALGLA